MKYAIIGGDSPTIKCCNKSKNFIYADNIDEAINIFNKTITSLKYRHIYLIVDFGITKQKFFETVKIDCWSNNFKFPFLIIAEYHYDEFNGCTRADNLIIRKNGITQEFSNNISAIKLFEYYYKSRTRCGLYIKYYNTDISKVYEIRVVNVEEIVPENNLYIKRIEVSKPDWINKKDE